MDTIRLAPSDDAVSIADEVVGPARKNAVFMNPLMSRYACTAPDEVYFFSADAAVQSRVITIVGNTSITVDSHQFVDGDLGHLA